MPISETLLNQLKCCFSNDEHVAFEPINVSCGAICCRECIDSSNIEELDCSSCRGKHQKKDLKDKKVIKAVETMMNFFLNDLLDYVKNNLEKVSNLTKGNNCDLF